MLSSILWLSLLLAPSANAFSIPTFSITGNRHRTTQISMGILDSLSNFMESRDGNFIKLEETETFGPGPVLILYKTPPGINDEEIQDMLSDGAPQAFRKGVTLARIPNEEIELLQCSLEDALNQVVDKNVKSSMDTTISSGGCPVLFFSGFDNQEMMATYNIIGGQIYQENGASTACAKAVLNAMMKPLGQVLEEISGDHLEAMSKPEED